MDRTAPPEITPSSSSHLPHEELRVVRGRRSGVTIAVAVHSTGAGPAIGGCRVTTYGHWREGVEDALRLSQAMSMKCALAGLPHGGGKTVAMLAEPLEPERRADLISDIGDVVGSFRGRYLTGPDIGTTPEDMEVIHAATGGAAFCRPVASGGSGNSSVATARGVLASLRAAVERTFPQPATAGLRVGVIGYGHVGSLIANTLVSEGASVRVHDANADLRSGVEASGAAWWPTGSIEEEIDVLVPAATGGVLSPTSAGSCGARLIVGPANNQITEDRVDQILHDRGVTWVPDVLASGGGIIHAVSRERLGLSETQANARVDAIGETTTELFTRMELDGASPLQAARAIADQRLGSAA